MSLCWSVSTPTVQVSVSPGTPPENGAATISCTANPNGGSVASLNVSVSGGTLAAGGDTAVIAGSSGEVTWNTPAAGSYTVQCDVVPGSCTNAATTGPVAVTVGAAAVAPVIDALQGPSGPVLAGSAVEIAVAAHDPAGGALEYAWSASGGTVSGSGATATWTAPQVAGDYAISVAVSSAGGTASSSVTASVVLSLFQGSAGAQVKAPIRLAADARGQIYVVDARDGTLAVLGANGNAIASLAVAPGERALAVTAGPAVVVSTVSGALYRVDTATGRAQPMPLPEGPLALPSGLSYDASTGLLWVAERGAGQLRALRADGTTAFRITAAGDTPLVAPLDVAVQSATGLVWVVMQSNENGNVLHAFNASSGAYAGSYLPFGGALGQLTRAGGIAAAGDRVFVSDIFQGQIQAVTPTGVPLGAVGGFGDGAGQLRNPAGLAIAPNGDLLVANMDLGRIDRFGASAWPATCTVRGQLDSDCDGMSDAWEVLHGLNPRWAGDAFLDPDADGLTNLQEFAIGTDPRNADTDSDGIPDAVELAQGTNPLVPDGVKPRLVVGDAKTSDPGLVRFSASLQGREPCTIAWKQTSGPEVALRGGDTLAPSFVGRTAGPYRFEGVATCGRAVSEPAVVEATVRNVAPRADPGRTTVVHAAEGFALDADFSSDANGDLLSFRWDQTLGPPLAGATSGAWLGVRAREPAFLEFQLTASDPAGLSASAEVPVLVLDDQAVAATAVGVSPVLVHVGDSVALDARASVRDGQADARFTWNQVSGPAVALANAASATPSFTAAAAGSYAFEVSISYGGQQSPPYRVEVYVAPAGAALPRAAIAPAGEATVGAPLDLDGTASAPGTSDGALAYRWRQVAGPAAGLTDGDRAVATVVPFAVGSYAFELSVSEGDAVSVPARVRFAAAAPGIALPVASASAPATARQGDWVQLDGSKSAGGERALSFRWTQVAGPWVLLEDRASATPRFHPRAAGAYRFELEVDDGLARSAPSAVDVLVLPPGSTR